MIYTNGLFIISAFDCIKSLYIDEKEINNFFKNMDFISFSKHKWNIFVDSNKDTWNTINHE
jgi:hypothetical protein